MISSPSPRPAVWRAPLVLLATVLIAGTAAAVGVGLGLRAGDDAAETLCRAFATGEGLHQPDGTPVSNGHELVAIEVDRTSMRSWTCIGATRTEAKRGAYTVTGFRYTFERGDGGRWNIGADSSRFPIPTGTSEE